MIELFKDDLKKRRRTPKEETCKDVKLRNTTFRRQRATVDKNDLRGGEGTKRTLMGGTDRTFLQVFLLVWCLLLLKMSICDDHAARLDRSPFKPTLVVIMEYKLIYKKDRINF